LLGKENLRYTMTGFELRSVKFRKPVVCKKVKRVDTCGEAGGKTGG
jgi:hypothetical protein